MTLVNSISLMQLRNNEYFELITDLKNLLPGVLPPNPAVDDVMLSFNQVYQVLDVVNRVDMGTVLTEKVQLADKRRGTTWRGMDLLVDAHLHSPVEKQKESAKILRRIFDVYGDYRKGSYDAESNDGRNLVQDLELTKNEEHCNRIKLNAWIPLYKTELEAFKQLQNQRDTEKGYKASGDVRAVRVKMDPLYREIINMVHAFVTLGMATAAIDNFIILMNQKVKRYNDMLAARQGRKDGDEEQPDNPIVD